ncbi:MAG: phage tail protein I [Burkholderiaceae bacterium]|jgi:phage tail P2-like protein|nr:phage tail protein I [Burkholderiaceae bacterium]
MSNQSILPPSLSADSRSIALEDLTRRFTSLDLTRLLVYLIDVVEPSALPHLAEQFSLFGDGWEMAESDEAQRNLIQSAVEIHRKKGTPFSIREVFRALRLGEVEIIEHTGRLWHDGQHKHNGIMHHGDAAKWAVYVVRLNQPVTRDQAESIRLILSKTAPARCHLGYLDFREAANCHNARINHDGQYTHGVV